MSSAVEDFARRILTKYEGALGPDLYLDLLDDLDAGECEVAAISAVEMAPVNDDEIDQLLRLANGFYGLDAEVAPLVAEKARQRLHAV